jgi:anti-sigma factor RsiW
MSKDFIYDCERTRDLLGLYADNELEGLPTSQMAMHLEQCAQCRRELEIIQSQKRLLASAIKNANYDTKTLRAAIELATIQRRSFLFSKVNVPGLPALSLAVGLIVVIGLGSLLYFHGRLGTAQLSSLYLAAANDHRTRSTASDAADWVQSDSAITERASTFLKMNMRLPRSFASDYSLVRARLCQLNGKSFLHLVYEAPDGSTASLFICPHTGALPSGQRTLTLDSRTLELTRTSDLSVNSTINTDCLLITVASDEAVATALLLNAASA